jgi:hypothetical protein
LVWFDESCLLVRHLAGKAFLLTTGLPAAIFCTLPDASVAQLAEQLTLNFGRVFSLVVYSRHQSANIGFLTSVAYSRLPKNTQKK